MKRYLIIGCIMLGDTSDFNLITKAITKRGDIEDVKLEDGKPWNT